MNVNLKFALRYLLRNSGKSLPGIISLTMGLALGVLLLSYVNWRFNFDRFLPDNDRIYKLFINTKASDGEISQYVHGPLAQSLMNDCPSVEYAARMYGPMEYQWFRGDREYSVTSYAVDSMFFKVMDFGLIVGKDDVLSTDADKVFLSEAKAASMFGEEDPVGQIILDNMKNPRTVAGVFKNIPSNTSLGRFDLLISTEFIQQDIENWDAGRCMLCYVKLRKGASPDELEEWLNGGMVEKYGLHENFKKMNAKYMVVPVRRAEIMVGTVRQYMDFFTALAILVMVLCALNYALLSISSLVGRSRTIGVLRCTAADRKDIWSQFMWETFFLMMISAILTVLILFIARNDISNTIDHNPVSTLFSLENIWVTVCVVLVLFFSSGMIPAGLFASVPTTVAFRGMSDRKKGWKQALLVFEIICVSFSSAFLTVSIRQINQLQSGSLGYNPKDMVTVCLLVRGGDYLFNAERDFETLSCVTSAGTSYATPIYGYPLQTPMLDEQTHEALFQYGEDYVSDTWFRTLEIDMVKGNTFSEGASWDDIVVNRAFLRKAGWDEESAIGRTVLEGNNNGDVVRTMRIIGVADDIRCDDNGVQSPVVYHSLRQSVANENYQYGGFRTYLRLTEVNEQNLGEIRDMLEKYETVNNRFIVVFYDSFLNRIKGEIHFRKVLVIVFIITSLIAIIGLTGYISDELKRRRKEIALRKVSGATLRDILLIISKDFSYIAVPAILTGEILAFAASRIWIQMFENRITLSFWIFFLTGAATLTVIYLVETLLSIKAANANPVESFKTE